MIIFEIERELSLKPFDSELKLKLQLMENRRKKIEEKILWGIIEKELL